MIPWPVAILDMELTNLQMYFLVLFSDNSVAFAYNKH